MKKTQDISQMLRRLHVPASSKLDERIDGEIAKATTVAPAAPSSHEFTFGQIFLLFLKKKSTRYTLATTMGLSLLVVLVLNHSTTSAWAMDQAIEALKKYKGLHFSGYYTGANGETKSLDAWARSDATGNRVETALLTSGNITTWTRDNKTYTYDRAGKNGYVQPGINLINSWLGPNLLRDAARMKDYKAVEGDDPTTGQKRVIVTCSLDNLDGPQSFLMEFDVRTKLLVSLQVWPNLEREGTPRISVEKILYFEDLPDSALSYQPPENTPFTDIPLEVPEANLSLLSDPKCGISADGMTREQACQKILKELWVAPPDRVRQLFPIIATWSDEMIRSSGDSSETIKEVLNIGGIEQTGSSKLGPLALVPCRIRYQDGSVRVNWMMVQFREIEGK
ncbi:MAG TPA: hypothetical protein VH597_16275, partial [Verrucomicrobiae bacterium]|nr:hypothetical protein [Verrucomicrobiae bacterium]